MNETWRQDAANYLKVKERYRLVGALDTEGFHPDTADLAELAQADLPRAYQAVKGVDLYALILMTRVESQEKLTGLKRRIRDTLDAGGNIQGYSMGSPKRVGDGLQHFWRQEHFGASMAQRFNSYGTGGDVSSTVPVRGVEDHPEYGARQMRDNGLRSQDLAICFVEGGETPSVLGAVQESTCISAHNVQFLYCNPDDQLRKIADVADVHDNPKVDRYSLAVGPMALAGSTRMQASTVLELMIGAALFNLSMDDIKRFVDLIHRFDYRPFVAFTEAETDVYRKEEFTLYRARDYAVTVASNHTELCPTFNWRPFENYNPENEVQDDRVSPTYLVIDGTHSHEEARQFFYGRPPETLEWVPDGIASARRFSGQDISENVIAKRLSRLGGRPMHEFNVLKNGDAMTFDFMGLQHSVPVAGLHPLFQNLLLKMILNTHTTLMMGRLGKYEQNLMSFVNSTLNCKLVDRSARIVEEKFRRENLPPPEYARIVHAIYEMAAKSDGPDDPPVPKAFAALKAEMALQP